MIQSRTIRLFLEDGRQDGIISAEVMNWTGHVIRARREDVDRLVERDEIKQRPGVYFLIGPPKKVLPLLYVGETENMSRRLMNHRASPRKSFWEDTIIVTSKDYNLTKAHVRYLEAQIRELAISAAKVEMVSTKKDGQQAILSRADQSDMASFLDLVKMVLLALGVDYLVKDEVAATPGEVATPSSDGAPPSHPTPQTRFVLMKKKKPFAYAAFADGKFVILKDSQAREDTPKSYNAYRAKRESLKERGIIAEGDGVLRFTQDVLLDSPSAASSIVLDRNSNGRTSWRLEGDPSKTFGAWDAERYPAPPPMAGESQDDEDAEEEDFEDEDFEDEDFDAPSHRDDPAQALDAASASGGAKDKT